MVELGLKGKMTDKDFTIHNLNNMTEEYDDILDVLENCLTSSGSDVLIIKVSNRNEKIKGRKKINREKEKCSLQAV